MSNHVQDTAGSTSARTLLTTGHVAWCSSCQKRQPIHNIRPWPDLDLRIAECGVCHSTVTIT